MAFTLSHAVVAPLIYHLSRKQIPLASIAIGAMTPDLLRIFGEDSYFGHTWTGVFSVDLAVGLIGCLLWYCLYRPFCYTLFSRYADAVFIRQSWSTRIFSCITGIIIGSITHLIWDGVTHDDFRALIERAWLMHDIVITSHIKLPVYRILQYASSIVALPFLYYLTKPILFATKIVPPCLFFRLAPWFMTFIACVYTWLNKQAILDYANHSIYVLIGHGFFVFIQGFLACLSFISLLFLCTSWQKIKNSQILDL